MTAVTTSSSTSPRTLTPTGVDRALLALSRALLRAAEARMRAHETRLRHGDDRRAARERGRSPFAEAEFTLRVR